MDSKGHKKLGRHKKNKIKNQERLIKKFPYRLPHLTEPSPESTQSWKAKSKSLKDKLPLQKNLVPTRSIPMPGLGAPEVTWPLSFYSPIPNPPLCHLWELKLLQLRFPTQDSPKLPPLQAAANQSPTKTT
ncbi:rCG56513 [Rattus norvegicus]|uniref:RCG56513 n=2 Tax=Rattus norvegicus TaxID=10116 RepID=A6IB75_RAT|nr:uncharacterized protein C3orf22 homolog [Rattus norvegicus]XP_038964284.1 uncharacterized protein C3orf22 homolog isoform X1 [Rattus norvegicus]XP_038964285.1 uncharacterized protein C3orf22 homolog isoform X1 [Rattus norvegicus]XP_038964286.1 uncharacterized protein C3orf22 homolog isoform X1 [Rattus norvegicus]XP_038964287.1 uncharacterized protein C3orf22 homolog isoform X1 [Rattus norvegicus]EDL91343.1 rCG56513 [Rattus norvegicus]|eukprot:NP_001102959.1 uncharacterized protein C3orf22 homolog [Rattus norvegicus]